MPDCLVLCGVVLTFIGACVCKNQVFNMSIVICLSAVQVREKWALLMFCILGLVMLLFFFA